jgi:small basic protein (TIGR04137 family)
MSLHPSLKVDTAGAQQRTVLTRIERIKDLMKKDLWHEEHPVTGLPKTKIIKVKAARKEEKTEEETTEGEAAVAAPAAEKK